MAKLIMQEFILSPDKDPMGTAIEDFYKNKKADKLRVFSSQFDEDEIPVKQLFRSYAQMPKLEKKALDLAKGWILDVGAGSGCHALALQQKGKEVCAIDISPASVDVMRARGVKDARLINLYDTRLIDTFDTILLLMNGSGIIGRLENMPLFFNRMRLLLRLGGSIYMDSSDLRYLYEDEDGGMDIDLAAEYYGLVDFRMQYKDVCGESFDWLYIDFDTLSFYAAESGFKVELIAQGSHYDYLARLWYE